MAGSVPGAVWVSILLTSVLWTEWPIVMVDSWYELAFPVNKQSEPRCIAGADTTMRSWGPFIYYHCTSVAWAQDIKVYTLPDSSKRLSLFVVLHQHVQQLPVSDISQTTTNILISSMEGWCVALLRGQCSPALLSGSLYPTEKLFNSQNIISASIVHKMVCSITTAVGMLKMNIICTHTHTQHYHFIKQGTLRAPVLHTPVC